MCVCVSIYIYIYTYIYNKKNLPINTDGKKYDNGIPMTGETIFKNQFGDIGNSRKHSKKKNIPS